MNLRVDRNALRFNQGAIIVLLTVAFVLGADVGRWMVLGVAAVMLAGTLYPPVALFKQAYQRIVVPSGLLKPHVVAEDPAPHQFAQGLGGFVLVLSFLSLLAGVTVGGWIVAGIVVALAVINLVFGFCLGCFLYFQLDRVGLGMSHAGGA